MFHYVTASREIQKTVTSYLQCSKENKIHVKELNHVFARVSIRLRLSAWELHYFFR